MIILLFFYSYPKIRIKKRKFATITQGFMGLVCSYIGIAFSSFNLQNFLLAIYSLISLCVFSVVKDFKDIEGDKKYSIYTLPVVLGKKKAVRFIQTMILIFIISSYIWKYFISQLTASFVILFFCVGLCGIICLELLNKGKIGGKALYKCGILLLALALLLLTLK
jgi:4-hydroxybenzoate polyprenyltransferase